MHDQEIIDKMYEQAKRYEEDYHEKESMLRRNKDVIIVVCISAAVSGISTVVLRALAGQGVW